MNNEPSEHHGQMDQGKPKAVKNGSGGVRLVLSYDVRFTKNELLIDHLGLDFALEEIFKILHKLVFLSRLLLLFLDFLHYLFITQHIREN